MVAGRWIDVGEEASLKKRQVSSGEVVDEKEKVTMTKEKKGNMRKRRMSKQNFNGYEDSGEKEEIDEEKDGSDYSTELVKKRGNGSNSNSSSSGGGGGGSSSVIEGSRCSRVNGRGWRCCQQTLVGYALCEHHLGKGRLRSMVSVRSRSSPPAVAAVAAAPRGDDEGSLPCLPCKQQEEDGDDEELGEKLMIMKEKKKKRKRKRIGTVKARSISSLLGQTHHAAAAAEAAAAATTAIGLGSNHSSSNDNIVA